MKNKVHKTLNIPYINDSLQQTRKLLITLGCSYTTGVGAVDQDILDRYPVVYSNGEVDLNLLDNATKKEFLDTYENLGTRPDGKLSWINMEHDNCYGNVLAQRYLQDSYTFVNFGRQAGGNYGPIARLFLYDIDYSIAEKIVVIFMPTSMARLEFLEDIAEHRQAVGGDTKTFWPGPNVISFSQGSVARQFCGAYLDLIHSDRYEIEKTLIEFQILQQWCKVNNAELIVFPAFNKIYNKKHFYKTIQTRIDRDKDHARLKEHQIISADAEQRVNKIDWTKFVTPQGCTNFYELCLKQEPAEFRRQEIDLTDLQPISPNKFVLPCGHPSAKGHQLMAEEFYKIFQAKGLI